MEEQQSFLRNLPPEEKKRLGYIEGRDDLFETKIFKIHTASNSEGQNIEKKNVLVISRDPGSANALVPVMELLIQDNTIAMEVVADGRAEEIFKSKFELENVTPIDTALNADRVLTSPDVLLIDSSTSERGIETYISANYPEVPMILVENYYTASHGFLLRLEERNLPYPRKICVIDGEAKKLITNEFPELEGRIEISGQPAFDRFALENTEKIKAETRLELGLAENEKLITFMSAGTTVEVVSKLAEELKKVQTPFKLAFGIHPRDNTPSKVYEDICFSIRNVLWSSRKMFKRNIFVF